jgi:oxygen-independent coproporphyrinogen-3 oxidase
LDPSQLARLTDALYRDRPLATGAEVTLETNPEDVTPASVRAWRRAGINRVSLGVQSFDPAVLTWMHRVHTADQVPRAVETLREAGFDNLSLDLIFALPAALGRDWASDLERALSLGSDHLSVYGLTVEDHTPLGRWVARGETQPPADERYAEEFLAAHRVLVGSGYRHYEVSNYGRPGREAVHNMAYWRRTPYLGLGPSAHSSAAGRRWWNLREWSDWGRAVSSGAPVIAAEELLTPEVVAMEKLYLGLRTDQGVPEAAIDPATRAQWGAAGWATLQSGRLALTPEGWLRLDSLVVAAGG